jgi:hypothetical protein
VPVPRGGLSHRIPLETLDETRMYARDYRDIIGGALMVFFGAFLVVGALTTMKLGTPQRMGPGLFPMTVGALLALLGICILVPACFRRGAIGEVEWRPLAAISGSILAFGLIVPLFGLAPAIAALVVLSATADRMPRPAPMVGLVLTLCLICYVVFDLMLGLTLPMFRLPTG